MQTRGSTAGGGGGRGQRGEEVKRTKGGARNPPSAEES